MKHSWRTGETVGQNVGRVLSKTARKWFTEGECAMMPGVDWDHMHRFRLLTKRFRYSLEIFAPAYGTGLVRRIGMLKKLQDYLGDINDCVTAKTLLGSNDPDGTVAAALAERAERKTAELREFWYEHFSGYAAVEAWAGYLKRYAGAVRPKMPQR